MDGGQNTGVLRTRASCGTPNPAQSTEHRPIQLKDVLSAVRDTIKDAEPTERRQTRTSRYFLLFQEVPTVKVVHFAYLVVGCRKGGVRSPVKVCNKYINQSTAGAPREP